MYHLTGVDINSIADIPSGTGMGSSSAFTVGLLNAIRAYIGKYSSAEKLASLACHVEIERVGSPIGKQDQYAAAYGGLNFITFNQDESVKVEKVIMDPVVKKQLEDNLLLIYIGGHHSANEILKQQSSSITNDSKFNLQKRMVKLAYDLREALLANYLDDFGHILHEGWLLKRSMVNGISNKTIDEVYDKGLKAGALGGKLLGAGGAGFILFYCPQERQEAFRREMEGCKMDYKKDILNYFEKVKTTIDKVSVDDLNLLMNLLNKARDEKKTVFICGNGGSASTASHYCCDFNKGISSSQQNKFRFVCLSDNVPSMMAYANDFSYEEIFVGPLRNLYNEGDYVIGISGSGNSSNVIKALQYANEHGGISIGITGYDGGIVKKICQYNVHIPIMDMQVSEDLHLMLDHCMMSILCKYGEER